MEEKIQDEYQQIKELKKSYDKGEISREDFVKKYRILENKIGSKVVAAKGGYRLPKKLLRSFKKLNIKQFREQFEKKKREAIRETIISQKEEKKDESG